jgi:cytochrome c oxidase subunit 3
MSETVLDHGYIPEEHAPDPVIGHGDPTPPGKVAIWLFLASEIMFFIGILGAYIVLRSGWPAMFEQQGKTLSKGLAGFNTLVLIGSSLTMALAVNAAQHGDRKKTYLFLWATFACALTFMVVKYFEYTDKFHHYAMVVNEGGTLQVYDGHWDAEKQEISHFYKCPVPNDASFRLGFTSPEWIKEQLRSQGLKGSGEKIDPEHKPHKITGTITQAINYGPWKNLFFASYFAATGVHGLHIIGGMIPLSILAIQAMRNRLMPEATEYIGLYWHFVDLVWIFLFPLMYLI